MPQLVPFVTSLLRNMFNIASVRARCGIAKVQQLLGYSAVAVTVRYTHTNLDSKKAVVAKLESFGDNLVTVRTKMQQSTP
jgi:hypothetical protein